MSPTGRLPGPYAEDACRFWNRDQYHLKLQKGSAELAHINVLHICDPNEEQQIERKSDKFLRKMGETHLSPRRKIESSSPRENRHQTRSQGGARNVRIRRTSGPRAKKSHLSSTSQGGKERGGRQGASGYLGSRSPPKFSSGGPSPRPGSSLIRLECSTTPCLSSSGTTTARGSEHTFGSLLRLLIFLFFTRGGIIP